jgi:hypothetical protein
LTLVARQGRNGPCEQDRYVASALGIGLVQAEAGTEGSQKFQWRHSGKVDKNRSWPHLLLRFATSPQYEAKRNSLHAQSTMRIRRKKLPSLREVERKWGLSALAAWDHFAGQMFPSPAKREETWRFGPVWG